MTTQADNGSEPLRKSLDPQDGAERAARPHDYGRSDTDSEGVFHAFLRNRRGKNGTYLALCGRRFPKDSITWLGGPDGMPCEPCLVTAVRKSADRPVNA